MTRFQTDLLMVLGEAERERARALPCYERYLSSPEAEDRADAVALMRIQARLGGMIRIRHEDRDAARALVVAFSVLASLMDAGEGSSDPGVL